MVFDDIENSKKKLRQTKEDQNMPKLNKDTIDSIRKDLNRLFLSASSFNIILGEKEEVLKIIFKENPEFYFIVNVPKDSRLGRWESIECPGDVFRNPEKYQMTSFMECRKRIPAWVDRIISEITVTPEEQGSVVEALRRNLEQNADSLPNPEVPFVNEEAQQWQEKLDTMIAKMAKLEEENKIQKGGLKELKRDIELLKEKITVLPKRTWLRAAGNKILDYIESFAKEGIKALAEGAVKGFLKGA